MEEEEKKRCAHRGGDDADGQLGRREQKPGDEVAENQENASRQGGEGEKETAVILSEHEAAFREAMDDDLNFPNALAAVFGLIRDLNILCSQGKVGQSEATRVFDTLRRLDSVLGFVMPERTEESDSEIDALVCAREEARKSKNWAEADRIRNLLTERNIVLEDRAGGTVWRRK